MNGMIAWFTRNSVASNLLMWVIVLSGLVAMFSVKQEVFPEFSLDMITVTVPYPGASPEEVEEAVCVRVEEEIQGVDGIKRLTSSSAENVGVVTAELLLGADPSQVLDDIKAAVDAIDTFPDDVEEPVIRELIQRRQVIDVAVYGEAPERTLKEIAERVRDDIAKLPGITQVVLSVVRPYEISIEVSETTLRRHGILFDDVVRAVRRSSLDLPGGSLKTDGGEILVRTKGQAYRGRDFESIPLLTREDGTRLELGDVATVIDGFEDTDQAARFDGAPTALISVFRVGDQSALDVAAKVKRYVAAERERLPGGVTLTTWRDNSSILRSRLDLMIRNGRNGFFLVFLALALFMRLRLAFWVSLGIPISFLGAFWLMPMLDVSINLISLFAFIVVLGIIVDDAIVVGENIFSHMERGVTPIQAAIEGTREVVLPVTFAVLTTIAAFSPLLSVAGTMGKVMRVIPLIVIPALAFSLIESMLILTSHLAHHGGHVGPRNDGGEGAGGDGAGGDGAGGDDVGGEGAGGRTGGARRRPGPLVRPFVALADAWGALQRRFATGLVWVIERVYRPSLRLGIEWRYLTVAWGVSTLLLTIGMVGGGWVRFTFFPQVPADYVAAMLTMPQGTPVEVTAEAVRRLEETAVAVREEIEDGEARGGRPRFLGGGGDGAVFKHMMTTVGEQPFRTGQGGPPHGSISHAVGSHLGEVTIELTPSEERRLSSTEIMNRWRERTGPVADAVELVFTSALFSSGDPINIQLTGNDYERLRGAAEALKLELAEYPGVFDINDSFRSGKQEIKLDIEPEAEPLGVTLADLARQVRQGFYGEEAQSIQRGRDDVKVMVRYPGDERRSLADLENMRIRTAGGSEVPFTTVARAEFGRGYDVINRTDRQRAVNVTADVDASKGNANEILADVERDVLPTILADHPGVRYSLEGEQREQRDTMRDLMRGFVVALIMIYALMAIPFRSYIQPLIVMIAIPFGIVGAIWGHLIMGLNLTILSLFGLVALTGVVVNDSLVLVDFINRRRAAGLRLVDAVREAGESRFRPILLTSVTTFAGLTPLLLEKSVQARFLIPMAVSLAFGVVFATFVTLVLVPASYVILEDVQRVGARWLGRVWKAVVGHGDEAPAAGRGDDAAAPGRRPAG